MTISVQRRQWYWYILEHRLSEIGFWPVSQGIMVCGFPNRTKFVRLHTSSRVAFTRWHCNTNFVSAVSEGGFVREVRCDINVSATKRWQYRHFSDRHTHNGTEVMRYARMRVTCLLTGGLRCYEVFRQRQRSATIGTKVFILICLSQKSRRLLIVGRTIETLPRMCRTIALLIQFKRSLCALITQRKRFL